MAKLKSHLMIRFQTAMVYVSLLLVTLAIPIVHVLARMDALPGGTAHAEATDKIAACEPFVRRPLFRYEGLGLARRFDAGYQAWRCRPTPRSDSTNRR